MLPNACSAVQKTVGTLLRLALVGDFRVEVPGGGHIALSCEYFVTKTHTKHK